MHRALAYAVALTLAVLAGCGGDSEPQATGGSASTGVTTTERPATRTDPGPAGQAVHRYLAAVESEVRAYEALRGRGNGALDRVNRDEPDASWDRAARELKQVRDEYGELTATLQAVEPPGELVQTHDAIVESLSLFEQIADFLAVDLAAHDVGNVEEWATTIGPLTERASELRDLWRLETLAAAQQAGIPSPGWVRRLGRTGASA